MPLNANSVNLVVHIDKGNLEPDEFDQLIYDLQARLESMNVETVDFVREQIPRLGTKAVDPVTVGALAIVVVQAVLPKVLDFLQAWSLRNQGHMMKVKVQRGDEAIEVEFSETTDPNKVKKYIEMITTSMNKKNKYH